MKHCGFVALIGRPSSGKSTFLNTLCGYKVSIVSPVPQTTRECIRAIYTTDDIQIIFLDTPGVHKSIRTYNRNLSKVAFESMKAADAVLCLLDLSRDFGEEEKTILQGINDGGYAARCVFVCNKADLVSQGVFEKRKADIAEIFADPQIIHRISALNKEDVVSIAKALGALLPTGEQLYPEDYYTDQTQRHRAAEIIREKIFLNFTEEIPHASCVLIEELHFDEKKDKVRVRASIYVETESQKGMIIGARGHMIRELGIASRADLEDIFGYACDVFLQVAVRRNWRKDKNFLRLLEQQYRG